ncbi:MAG: cation:proton antiporter [Nibricoccus sp.]
MHSVTLLQDLAVVMLVASVVMIVFRRLKQPVVLGYIIAGVIIGPHTPPYSLIHDEATINTLSELGVVLLMFSLGLEFSLRKLKSVGAPALIAALMEIFLLFWVGYEIGKLFGWGAMDSIFLGAMLSMSSTTVIIKVLGELGKMKERFAQLIFGVLIIEDILGIAMIALLSGVAMTGSLSVGDVGKTLGKLSVFLAVVLVAGLIAVPRLIRYVARFKSNEMLIITVLGLCFGVSLLAVKLGYSVALGAFVIGAVIAEAREIHRIETLIEPIRDMFSAVFFVAIGLLIDPKMLIVYWQPIVVISLAVVVGKIVTCSTGAFLGGNNMRDSLRVGMGLAQIGEFSFIIASLGVTLKVTSPSLYPIAVAVSAITTLLTPYLIRSADTAARVIDTKAPRRIRDILGLYTAWIGRIGDRQASRPVGKLLWKLASQMALNAVLIAAIFIVAAYLEAHPAPWIPESIRKAAWFSTAIWLCGVVFSLPLFVATSRKLQAFGLLVAESKVTHDRAEENTAVIRAVIARIIPILGMIALGLFVLILSATLLPPLHILLVLLALAALVAWLMSRSFVKVYSTAQAAIQETFTTAETGSAHNEPPEPNTSPLLSPANLETITIPAHALASGKLIRELSLRSTTGATIVCIERGGTRLFNPSADEEVLAADKILLLGSAQQLSAATRHLTATENTTSS